MNTDYFRSHISKRQDRNATAPSASFPPVRTPPDSRESWRDQCISSHLRPRPKRITTHWAFGPSSSSSLPPFGHPGRSLGAAEYTPETPDFHFSYSFQSACMNGDSTGTFRCTQKSCRCLACCPLCSRPPRQRSRLARTTLPCCALSCPEGLVNGADLSYSSGRLRTGSRALHAKSRSMSTCTMLRIQKYTINSV
jgi:hypothetical protein